MDKRTEIRKKKQESTLAFRGRERNLQIKSHHDEYDVGEING